MFGIGFFEIVVIALIALVCLGPKRLPELMRQLGKAFVYFRRAATDVRETFDGVVRDAEREFHREKQETLKAIKGAEPKTISAKADPQDESPYDN